MDQNVQDASTSMFGDPTIGACATPNVEGSLTR
jgi:hypothetical protein